MFRPFLFQVCKHFLHAIEKGIYGWFWECPSGDKCIYRHALPPGFVFKKQLKEQEDLQLQDSITLEELVETEVHVLQLCPVAMCVHCVLRVCTCMCVQVSSTNNVYGMGLLVFMPVFHVHVLFLFV